MIRSASRLIVALDHPTLPDAMRLVRRLRGTVECVKIGSVLFTSAGPTAVQRMQALGLKVFLDLKFHDIPSTVEKSCRAATRHGAWMLTLHASGGRQMLEAAVAGAADEAAKLKRRRPLLVGVTVLTHVEARDPRQLQRRVLELTQDAKRAGLDGVVASAQEAEMIRKATGWSFVIVCPGIRPSATGTGGRAKRDGTDQARIATPGEAVARGASYLVVGRPITEADDPPGIVQQLLNDMEVSR